MTTLDTYQSIYELEFERPLLALERQIAELENQHQNTGKPTPGSPEVNWGSEIRKLRQSHTNMLRKIYSRLNAWNVVKVARHPARPQTSDYLRAFVKDFAELHGDRAFGDDPAVIAGFGRIGSYKCMVIGHNKGRDTKEKIACHFGCAHPEGYRKALRCMKLAEKYELPVVTLVDTPGAYPGIGAEERGQAQAIALNLQEMSRLKTPIISVVIGEGGSGGALGIAVADRVAMMQYSWYSVISPEGCAAILWKAANQENNASAAESLKLTSQDNMKVGTIDDVIEEPLGGAHRNPTGSADRLEKYLIQTIRELKRFKIHNLVNKRYQRLRNIGAVEEA